MIAFIYRIWLKLIVLSKKGLKMLEKLNLMETILDSQPETDADTKQEEIP